MYTLTGKPMSRLQEESRREPSPYRTCMLGLCFRQRETLYGRIDRRVDKMLRAGLLEEAKALRGTDLSRTAGQAIGYKELFAWLDGQSTREEAVELLKMQTRRYAKRQMTWLRRDARIRWLEWEKFGEYEPLLEQAAGIVRAFFKSNFPLTAKEYGAE